MVALGVTRGCKDRWRLLECASLSMATIHTNVLTATRLANGISVGFGALLSVLLLFLDPELGSFTSRRLRWDHVLSLVRGCIACD